MGPLTLEQAHWDALTAATRDAVACLAGLPLLREFYLAGGTGLALHLGHRYSIDLDFFSASETSVGADTRAALRQALDDPTLAITYDKDATFVATWRGVGISFFRLHLYPLVRQPLLVGALSLATIEEIGAMKLAATIGRGTRRDLVDLYFILQQVTIDELFAVAAIKYARVRSFGVSATRGLAYFEDADAQPMPRMIDRTPWPVMKHFLEEEALKAGRQHLQDLWHS